MCISHLFLYTRERLLCTGNMFCGRTISQSSSGYQSRNTTAGYGTLSDTGTGRMSYRLKRGSTTSRKDLWPLSVTALESSIMVLNNLSVAPCYTLRRAVFRTERHALARKMLIEIYRNAFPHAPR